MPMTSLEMIKYLKRNGFIEVSQNGSHIKMRNTESGKTVIIPYHCKDLKKVWSRLYKNRPDLDSQVPTMEVFYEKIILPGNISQSRGRRLLDHFSGFP